MDESVSGSSDTITAAADPKYVEQGERERARAEAMTDVERQLAATRELAAVPRLDRERPSAAMPPWSTQTSRQTEEAFLAGADERRAEYLEAKARREATVERMRAGVTSESLSDRFRQLDQERAERERAERRRRS